MCRNSFLYFISTLLTTCYCAFGFTLDIQIKVRLGLYILNCNPFFYILYLLLITICRPAFGLTLDINKEKYTKLSVVLFSVVLRVANFLLFGYSPPIMQGPSSFMARNSVELFFFCCFFVCIKLLGNVVRVYPKIVQGLTFLSA